jgi:hypothetical protein
MAAFEAVYVVSWRLFVTGSCYRERDVLEGIRTELLLDTVEVNGSNPFRPKSGGQYRAMVYGIRGSSGIVGNV